MSPRTTTQFITHTPFSWSRCSVAAIITDAKIRLSHVTPLAKGGRDAQVSRPLCRTGASLLVSSWNEQSVDDLVQLKASYLYHGCSRMQFIIAHSHGQKCSSQLIRRNLRGTYCQHRLKFPKVRRCIESTSRCAILTTPVSNTEPTRGSHWR